MIKIEKINLNDIKEINKILSELGLIPYPDFDLFHKSDNFLCLKVVVDKKIVGGIILSIVLDEAEIYDIFVREKFQREGIGSKLLNYVEGLLLKMGIRKLFLEVRASNHKAINFYKKNGFLKIGIRHNYYKSPLEDGLIFSKDLRDA